jgi:4-amino-4-deoxy-L-arabinose transferase-like glycosyltransferase
VEVQECYCESRPEESPAQLIAQQQLLSPPLLVCLSACLLLCWFLFFYRLADRDLWSSHEGRAAQDAQTILSDHHWGLPRLFDGKIELQKPPFYYWLVAGTALLRGGPVDAWCVRLPAACAALGGVVVVFALALYCGRWLAGGIAASMLATAMHYTWLARIGRIDMPLTFAITLTLVGFYLGRQSWQQKGRGWWGWFLLAYVAAASAALLKGPIGLILPAGVAAVHLWMEKELPGPRHGRRWLRLAHELGLWWGVPLLLVLVLPWYIWADLQTNGKFFQVFFWKHNIERGFGGGSLTAHPWWFYGPRLTFDLLPWSLLLPFAAWLLMRRNWWRNDAEIRFGLAWLVTMVLLLSCSRFKRADYLLPAYPGAALFLGSLAERCHRELKYRKIAAVGFSAILAAVAVGWWIYLGSVLPREEPRQEFRRFAAEIRRWAPAPQPIIFFRTEAHALAFHVGRPIDTILEWENLDYWCARPETYYVVMPPENAQEWPEYLHLGQLEEVLRSSDLAGGRHAHPFVLLRTRPGAGPLEDQMTR